MSGKKNTKIWFTQNVEENMDALYGVALRLTGKSADAEDLVAEAVTKAWCALDSLENRAHFRSWLFRILRNLFISNYRKQSVRPVEISWSLPAASDEEYDICSWLAEQPNDFLQWWANPEREVYNRFLGEQIMSAIEELPEAFRVTVLLINVEGLTYDEAAEALGVPAGTIRSRMKRGRTLLQKVLWQQAQDAGLAVQCQDKGEPYEQQLTRS
ncbi:MAG: sigma-70 family RNA polymerase sigma factor [Arenicellales bacterium]|nr:sigma-70 family RNA polymerase sigma factor [Arenicellales bacterium]